VTSLTDIMAGKAPKDKPATSSSTRTSAPTPGSISPLANSTLFSGAVGDPVPGTDLLLIKPRPPYTIAL